MPPSPPPTDSAPRDAPHSDAFDEDDVEQAVQTMITAGRAARDGMSPDRALLVDAALDDLAAATLARRHANRQQQQRERELEWDEQDNARRARALLDRLFPGDNGIYIDADSDDDEAEHVAGFDGDDYDHGAWLTGHGEEGDDDDLLMDDDFPALFPGFIAERPLNPPPVSWRSRLPPNIDSVFPARSVPRDPSSSTSFCSFLQPGAVFSGKQTFGRPLLASSRVQLPASSDLPILNYATSSSNSSSGSLTNFLTDLGDSSHVRRTLPPPAPTAYSSFGPFPSAQLIRLPSVPDLGPSSSLAIPRPAPSSSSPSSRFNPYLHPSAPQPPPQPTSHTQRTIPASWLDLAAERPAPSSSSSSAPAFSPAAWSSSSLRPSPTSSSTTLADRTRALVALRANPQARSSRSSWRAVEEEMLARAEGRSATGAGASAGAGTYAGAAGRGAAKRQWEEQEQWAVKVVIHTYDPAAKLLTGVMRAHGVPPFPFGDSSSPSSFAPLPTSDVVTYFSGHIVDPLSDGLFASPSPTGAGGSEFKVSRASEAESWVQLGPFKGMEKAELVERAKSREWVEDKTQGWVLWRLKERGFVNVTEKDSALSIAGFYHIALNRSTGEIEGLYSDPTATPYQRLNLMSTSDEGALSLGTFGFR
ncbi:hypothetical protein JCM10207_002299 [Rhodosporidiobolus poonsookiae]